MTRTTRLLTDKIGTARTLLDDAERQDDVYELLHALDLAQQTAQSALHTAVKVARERGASWADVGDAFGVSRQAAQQRFGG
jgi:hypothetical protein